MDRSLQSARRAGHDDARDEHDPAPADAGPHFLNAPAATGTRRCVVHVLVGTDAIRARFDGEKPPVPDVEWDEAGYVEQRLCAYRDALDALARVQTASPEDGLEAPPPHATTTSCAHTGDRIVVDLGPIDAPDRETLRADVERALQRVFADANAWRRALLPAYFERHRAWRSVAGGPIQH